jgi:hypothetical protein
VTIKNPLKNLQKKQKFFHVFLLVVFCLMYLLNIFYLIDLKATEKELDYYIQLENSQSDLKNKENYYSSLFYKDLHYKEQSYKQKGEFVIDTKSLEVNVENPKQPNYIEYYKKEKEIIKSYPLDLWIKCLNGDKESKCLEN